MSDLLEEWQANNDRPQWVQTNRDRLQEALGDSDVEIPSRLGKIDDYLTPNRKGAITRALKGSGDEDED